MNTFRPVASVASASSRWAIAGVAVAKAFIVVVTLASGCATATRTRSFAPPVGDVSGTWEGTMSRDLAAHPDAPGDHETQKHIWRLRQIGTRVTGVVFIEYALESRDGRPYLCSGRTRLTTWVTSEVEGHRDGARVLIRTTGTPRADGPCPPVGVLTPLFDALLHDEALSVSGSAAPRRLVRRQPARGGRTPTTAELAVRNPSALQPVNGLGGGSVPLANAELHGHWVWEQQDQLPSGDAKREREEWHLVQEGTEVVGFYDRVVEQRSNDGRLYRCNGALDFRSVTRYRVRGVVSGAQVLLTEQAYEVLEGGPCDDGRRQLDSYQGEIRDSHVVLHLGAGRQVLRKARPNVPTQSF